MSSVSLFCNKTSGSKVFLFFGLEKNQSLLLSRDPPLADLQNKLIGSRMGPTLKGERINKCSGVSVERATEREREREREREGRGVGGGGTEKAEWRADEREK